MKKDFTHKRYILKSDFKIPGLEDIKLFSYTIQVSMKFILLINVKMPTIVGIFTLMSRINTTSESFGILVL